MRGSVIWVLALAALLLLAAACAQDDDALRALEVRVVVLEQAGAVKPSPEQVVAPLETRVAALEEAPSAQAVTPLVRAQRLEIVDEAGQARLLLSTEGGRPSVVLADLEGQIRAWLFLREDGSPNLILINRPRFILMDETGEIRAIQSLDQTGAPILTQVDARGEVRATLRLAADGAPVVELYDEAGSPVFTAP